MKRLLKRFLAFFCSLLIILTSVVKPTAHAIAPLAVLGYGTFAVTLADFGYKLYQGWADAHSSDPGFEEMPGYDFLGVKIKPSESQSSDGTSGRTGSFSTDVCRNSPNNRHNYVQRHTQVDNKPGVYWVCEYCGRTVDEDFNSDYQDKLSSLPASSIGDDGGLYWKPAHTASKTYVRFQVPGSGVTGCSHDPYMIDPSASEFSRFYPLDGSSTALACTVNCLLHSVYGTVGDGRSSSFNLHSDDLFSIWISDTIPITGSYSLQSSVAYISNYVTTSDSYYNTASYGSDVSGWMYSTGQNFSAGSTFNERFLIRPFGLSSTVSCVEFSIIYHDPVYKITPNAGLSDSVYGDYYYNTTRIGNIEGNYGVIGNDNSTVTNTTNYIVNEGDNTYTNPVTNTTSSISNWTYDYSDRSYTLTLDTSDQSTTGDTVTVTYGDEYITINEGDSNTYNVYYIIESDETEPSPSPSTCNHNYTDSITQQPSCTVPGVRTYTCSLCSNSYTESVPALGHDWQVKTSVQTEYDQSGNMVQQGYTIFRCSRCGEEYRSDDGIPPATGGGDSSDLTLPEKLVDVFKRFGTFLSNLFSSVPELFSNFTAFLAAVFPFLPEEFFTVLLLGVLLLISAGIIRRFLR